MGRGILPLLSHLIVASRHQAGQGSRPPNRRGPVLFPAKISSLLGNFSASLAGAVRPVSRVIRSHLFSPSPQKMLSHPILISIHYVLSFFVGADSLCSPSRSADQSPVTTSCNLVIDFTLKGSVLVGFTQTKTGKAPSIMKTDNELPASRAGVRAGFCSPAC